MEITRRLGLFGIAAIALLIGGTPALAEKRIALVVGNSSYRNIARLDNPANDARLIAETLRGLGFALTGGGAQLDLDKAGIDRAVQSFGVQLQGADVGLFYYAGHGMQVHGGNYLVPVDANPTREADIDFQMLDTNLLLRQMEGSGARLNVVIFDACRNNPFGGRGLRAADSGLAQMRAPEGTLISFATQPGNVAQDGADGNSPYTKALAQTLRRPGLGIFDTINEVGLAVKRATGGAQEPWFSSSPIDGRFFFAGLPPAADATRPAPPPDPCAVASEHWRSVEAIGTKAAFEDHLARFASCAFAGLARARIAALAPLPPAPAPTPPPLQPLPSTPPMAGADISGAGATFPYPIYAKWSDAYKKAGGAGLNYQSIGSGGGIKQIQARTVTFGATDVPLPIGNLNSSGLLQFPTVMGGVVPIVNVSGIAADQLVLDGATLARIFLGNIKSWNDPDIRRLNPNAALPAQSIVVVHRSDGSGTTFNFADYLAKVSADWKAKLGVNTTVEWPTGIGARGNEGVANTVAQTLWSIGYVELAYAKQNRLSTIRLVNRDGGVVAASPATIQAAAANAGWDASNGFALIPTNMPGAGTWPIATATFILMPRQPADPTAAADALRFFAWAFANGNAMAGELDYVPLPANVKAAIARSWTEQIKAADGRPVFRP